MATGAEVLNMLIPKDWKIKALDAMSEYEIASHLSESIIFLAFSEFEGLPVPPVEAALSGNIVIGYHGQGGREYWTKPSFVEIEQGDIKLFVSKTIERHHEDNGVGCYSSNPDSRYNVTYSSHNSNGQEV